MLNLFCLLGQTQRGQIYIKRKSLVGSSCKMLQAYTCGHRFDRVRACYMINDYYIKGLNFLYKPWTSGVFLPLHVYCGREADVCLC